MNLFLGKFPSLPMILFAALAPPLTQVAISAEVFVPSKQALIGKAVRGKPMTLSEANMLEPACIMIYSAGQGDSGTEVWYEKLKGNPVLDRPENHIARGANSYHHYCYAELSIARYYNARNAKEKKAHLLNAYSEYSFMTSHPEYLPKDWPFLQKMYVKLGETAALMGRNQESIRAFLKAIDIDPKYELAYTGLADLMVKNGSKAKALEFVTEGLRHKPESKRLARRFEEVGGKRPYPTPYPVAEIQDVEVTPSKSGATATQTTTPSRPAPQVPVDRDMPGGQVLKAPPSTNNGALGEPNNPHCRFCP